MKTRLRSIVCRKHDDAAARSQNPRSAFVCAVLPGRSKNVGFRNVFRIISLVALFALFSMPAELFAGRRYAVASASWNSTSTWSSSSGGGSGASIPTSSDTVFIYETSTARSVTIPSGYSASCAALYLYGGTGANTVLNFTDGTSTLTISGDMRIPFPPGGYADRIVNIGPGTCTVGGDVQFGIGCWGSTASRETHIRVSTGTLNILGDLIYHSGVSTQHQLDLSWGAGRLNLGGNITLNYGYGLIAPGTSSTVNLNGTAQQTLNVAASLRYNNLYINNTAGVNLGAAVTSTLVAGDIRVQSGTFRNAGYNIAGGFGNTFEVANGAQFMLGGTSGMVTGFGSTIFGATSTVDYYGTNQTVSNESYGHLKLTDASSGTASVKTLPGTSMSVAGDFTIWSGGGATSVTANANAAITVSGNFYINSSTTFNAGSATHNVKGAWANSGTFNHDSGEINFNGTVAQTISGSSVSSFYNLSIANTSAVVSVNTNANVSGTLNLNGAATVLAPAAAVVFNSAAAAGTVTGTGTLRVTRTAATAGYSQQYKFSTNTLTNLTVDYNSTAAQTVSAVNYGHLKTSGARAANSITFASGTVGISGVFSPTATFTTGAYILSGNTVSFNGGGAQTIPGFTFNNLTIAKTSGSDATLSGDIFVPGTLSFGSGKIITGSHTVISGPGAISGASQSTGWVFGNLQRDFSASVLSGTFPIGCANYYSPITLSFSSITGSGGLKASVAQAYHPSLSGSGLLSTKSLQRYWSLSNPGGLSLGSYTVGLGWNVAENYFGFSTSFLGIAKYTSSTWSDQTVTGTTTTTAIQANNVSGIGDFVVGQKCDVTGSFSYAGSPYCSGGGTASVTLGSGATAGAFSASPAGLSINAGTGAVNLSASLGGTYTVTNTITGTGGCIGSETATITVSASATISYTGSPYCNTGTTASVTRTGTAGGTYSSTAGLSINSSTGAVNLSASTPGTYTVTYTLAASPPCAAFQTTASITVSAPANISQIPTSSLIANYPFDGSAADATGNNNGTLRNAPSSTSDRFGLSGNAYVFNGSTQYVSTANWYNNPTTFSISVWFKTTSTAGGVLVGFGNTQTGASSSYDRHIYMSNAGQIFFGVYPGAIRTINSTASYNDGQWHMATATLSGFSGMRLYIDGVQVDADAATTSAENYAGYWRIGYNALSSWPSAPSNPFFDGTLDDIQIYHRAISATEVGTLYRSPDGAGNNGPLCGSGSLTLSATTISGASYAWTGPNSYTSAVQNPVIPNASVYSGTYMLQVSAGGCISTAYTNVVATKAGFSYPASSYCVGAGSATISLMGGATAGTFTASPAGLVINSSTGAVNLLSSAIGTYTVTNTVNGPNSCVAVATANITVAGASISQIPTSGLIANYTFTGDASDATGSNNGILQGAPSLTTGRFNLSNCAYSFNGSSQYMATTNLYSSPSNYTTSVWFKTSAATGGVLVGFCNNQTGASTTYDRVMYMTDTGRIIFGIYDGFAIRSISSAATYNDGEWHFATATMSSVSGMKLFIDGVQIAANAAYTTSYSFNGYWRVGYSTLTYYPSIPTSLYFNGVLDDIRIYHRAISAAEVTTLYNSPDGAGNSGPLCGAGSITLTATTISGATYSWSGPNGFTSSTQNPVLSNANAFPGVYSVQVTASGCTSTAHTKVVATTTGFSYANSPYCKNYGTATVTLNAAASSGTFTSAPAGLSLNSSTGAINLSASTPGTYTVTNTANGAAGCVSAQSTSVTVVATPSATISYSGSPFCQTAGPVSVIHTGTTGGSYSAPAGLSIHAVTGTITPATSTPGTYTVTYTIPANGGCNQEQATTSVTISPAPSATISYAGNPFCASGNPGSVTRTGTAGGTYSAGAGLSINAATGTITPALSTPGSYTVTYTVPASAGCALYTTTCSVTISTPPTATISYPASPLCTSGSPTSVTRTGHAGGIYLANPGLSINSSTGAITPASSTAGTYTVHYVMVSGGCTDSATASVTIDTPATATISYAGSPFCESGSPGGVTRIGASGGVFSSSAGLNIDSASGDIDPTLSTVGIYTVTYAMQQGACSSTATTSVTITAAPSATINYAGSPLCSTGGPAAVTLTGSSGGAFSATAGLSIDASSGTITPTTSTPGTYDVSYTIAAAGGCPTYITTTNVVVAVPGTWTGAVSTDWHTSGNWYCGAIPTASTDVLIGSGLPRYPLVSTGTGTARDITIQNGASLAVTSILQIAGAVTSNGTFTASNGSVEFNGATAQSIPAGLFAANTIKNLTVNNTAGVTLGGNLGLTGILKATAGNLSAGNYLTLMSSAAQTALIDGSGAGNVLGNVTMQRYLPSGFGYRYLSSPFQSATVSELADDVDLTASFARLYRYDENLTYAGWLKHTDSSDALNPLEGYAVNLGSSTAATTVDMTGVVNNGAINPVTLYNHDRLYTRGFNLVGNPYPSPIDWTAASGWTKTNIDNAIYYFNNGTADQYQGTYSSYINGVSSDGLASNIIPAMQGFFVHVSNGSFPVTGSLGVSNSVRVTTPNPVFHKKTNSEDVPLFRISAGFADREQADPAVVYFNPNASAEYDQPLDALKMLNTDVQVPSLYCVSGEQELSINAIPEPTDDTRAIPLGLRSDRAGTVIFKARDLNLMPAGLRVYFADAHNGAIQELMQASTYQVELPAGRHHDRFFLLFSRGQKVIMPGTEELTAYSAGSSIFVKLTGGRSELQISNMLGQVVRREVLTGDSLHEIPMQTSTGTYIVTLTTAQGRQSKKVFLGNR